ncbi:MAG: hypothetical protein KDD70_11685 [Bdellovibrionales bacterium]|nr:hypothetical protein [Bdellovibrionales bacterium]
MRAALIDLGTNSVRLHILERTPSGALKRVFQRKEMIQLGVGLFTSGDFTEEAKERALAVFREFRHELKYFNVSLTKAVATCAMREARSGKELRDEIEKETGIALQIISGEAEAEYISRGILNAFAPFEEKTLLVDIGGGSTELSYVLGEEVLHASSTPLGAVRCQEVTLRSIPATAEAEEELRAIVRTELLESVPEEVRGNTLKLIGSSGSIRAIVRLIRQTDTLEQSCSTKELDTFVASLRNRSLEELLARPQLEPKRGKIIFAAAVILDEIANTLGIEELRAVPLGLKDGLLVSLRG